MIEIRRKQLDSAQRFTADPRRAGRFGGPERENYGSRVFYTIVRDGKRLDTALTIALARKRAKRHCQRGEVIIEDGGIRL